MKKLSFLLVASLLLPTLAEAKRKPDNKPADRGLCQQRDYPHFASSLELDFTLGDYNLSRMGLYTSFGVQANPYLYAGVGFGVTAYADDAELVMVPVYAHLRARLPMRQTLAMFVDARPGYGAKAYGEIDGGFYLSLLAGVEGKHWSLGVGLSLQNHNYDRTVKWWGDRPRVAGGFTSVGPSIRLGYRF